MANLFWKYRQYTMFSKKEVRGVVEKSLKWPTSGYNSSVKFDSLFIWSFLGTDAKVEVPAMFIRFFLNFFKL